MSEYVEDQKTCLIISDTHDIRVYMREKKVKSYNLKINLQLKLSVSCEKLS